MNEKTLQILSIPLILLISGLIVWLYAKQPASFQEVVSKAAVTAGTYSIDEAEFTRGLALFRQNNFTGARESFAKADPEGREARVQFYNAYSFYREGFGRMYSNDALFQKGLEGANRTIELKPDFRVDDQDLKIKTAQELKKELQDGLESTVDDINPMKLLRERK